MPSEALDALHKLGRGRPRLLNTLADNALFEAYLAGRNRLEAGDIERAAADLGIGADPGETYIDFARMDPASSRVGSTGPRQRTEHDVDALRGRDAVRRGR